MLDRNRGGDYARSLSERTTPRAASRSPVRHPPRMRWYRMASGCRWTTRCASWSCRRLDRQRWRGCSRWYATASCACWRAVVRCLRKGRRTHGRRTKRSLCSSASGGRAWRCGHRPGRCPGAPSLRVSPSTATHPCTPTTGRAWSGCAGMGREVPWRWSASSRRRTAASPTA